MWHDIAYSCRIIAKNLRFAALAVATLALGIGAATAVFAVFDAALIRAVAGPRAGAARRVHQDRRQTAIRTAASPIPSFVIFGIAAAAVVDPSPTGSRASASTPGNRPNAFASSSSAATTSPTLGVQAARGRLLTPDDDRVAGGHPVAVMSYATGSDRTAAADSALGSTIRINGFPFTVVGITRARLSRLHRRRARGAAGADGDAGTDFAGLAGARASVYELAPHLRPAEARRHDGRARSRR